METETTTIKSFDLTSLITEMQKRAKLGWALEGKLTYRNNLYKQKITRVVKK